MNRWRINMLAAAGFGAFVALAACDEFGADEKPAAAAAGVASAPATPVTPPPPLPEGATLLGGVPLWNITAGGVVSGKGGNGKASLPASGILSVIASKAPVVAGDTITIKASVNAPVDRPLRIYAMRHCNNGTSEEATAAEIMGTGGPMPIEVTHTFAQNYDCIRFSLTTLDKLPIDVEVSNLQFIKMPKT